MCVCMYVCLNVCMYLCALPPVGYSSGVATQVAHDEPMAASRPTWQVHRVCGWSIIQRKWGLNDS